MSSVWNHAPNRSMSLYLRAAHFSSRSFRKGCSYSTSFRPIYPKSLDSPVNAFLNPSSSTRPGTRDISPHGISHDGDPSSCEFWCTLRLRSQFSQFCSPLIDHPRPCAPKGLGEHDKPAPNPSHVSRETKPSPEEPEGQESSTKGVSQSNAGNEELARQSYDPSPSGYLIDTLQNLVLSSQDPNVRNWTFSGKGSGKPLMAPWTVKRRMKFREKHGKSLQGIVADYIQDVDSVLRKWGETDIFNYPAVDPELERALQSMLREDLVHFLESRQYDIADVMAWAWVLKSATAYEATLRIFLLEADQVVNENTTSPRVPAFIPLLLLRQNLDLKTFRLLLTYSLHLITGQPIPRLDLSLGGMSDDAVPGQQQTISTPDNTNAKNLIDPSTCITYIVRLLDHARKLWPEAQLSIAQAFSFYLSVSSFQASSFMAEKFNLCLRLLSLPSKSRPFASASIQQQAQFELLKAMANHHPVLPVNRRGYQGLIAVQLAHKKTAAERQYAELKAPSWPPWKEEKLGIDSHRGVEGLKSRAMRVIYQMKEAGYPPSLWEQVSGILAGWDTDNSPTIQTRALVRRPQSLRKPAGRSNHYAIWEARIRATRTVREAWACFVAYEDKGLPPHSAIYAAMAEKLIFRDKAVKESLDYTRLALPGDGLEPFPEPASARDWIYTPSEPPTLDTLIKRMLSQGIRPTGRFLAMLLQYAPTLRVGLAYLSCSDLTNQQIRALCTVGGRIPEHDAEVQTALDELPDYLVSAFVHFLCRFSILVERSLMRDRFKTEDSFPILSSDWSKALSDTATLFSYAQNRYRRGKLWHPKLLSHAIGLLRKRDSQNPQGWLQLLSALRSTRILDNRPSSIGRHTQMVLAWHEIVEVLNWLDERGIDIGSDGFRILCNSFSSAVTAGVKDPDAVEKGLELVEKSVKKKLVRLESFSPKFEDMVESGLNTLKSQFDRLVFLDPKTTSLFESCRHSLERGTDSRVTLPALPHVPSPAALHAFVRSLGMAEDSDGILSLLRWMGRHAATLKEASGEYSNGDRMTRRTVVAIRLFLEGYWGRDQSGRITYEPGLTSQVTPGGSDEPTFSDPTLQEAYDIVTAAKVWGPWPSDEEVQDYVAGWGR